jgi:hypothetical protein
MAEVKKKILQFNYHPQLESDSLTDYFEFIPTQTMRGLLAELVKRGGMTVYIGANFFGIDIKPSKDSKVQCIKATQIPDPYFLQVFKEFEVSKDQDGKPAKRDEKKDHERIKILVTDLLESLPEH